MVVADTNDIRIAIVGPVYGFCIEFSNRSFHLYAVLSRI
jgi:hypothetical protein